MSVRPARESDAEALARVHERCWTVSYAGIADASWLTGRRFADRVAEWVGLCRGEIADLWVAEDGAGRAVGFVAAGPSRDADADDGTGEVIALYVDPAHQRSGHGRALMEQAIHALREQGFTQASLWTLEGNTRGRRFYAAMGWRPGRGRKEHRSLGAHEIRYCREL